MAKKKMAGPPELVGRVVLVQEALGYFVGTLYSESPLALQMGADCVWVRNMGSGNEAMTTAYNTGQVQEFHHLPWRRIYVHAVRHIGPWEHPTPRKAGG